MSIHETQDPVAWALARTRKSIALAKALTSFRVQCPFYPQAGTVSEADHFVNVFCRYSLRALYYAETFLTEFSHLQTFHLQNVQVGASIPTPVQDEIFFDFDAFVFGTKSIFSKEMFDKGRFLHSDMIPAFRKLADSARRELIDPYLNNVRNEVVHLSVYGSGIGSFGRLTNLGDHWSIEIMSAFHTEDGGEVELVALFYRIYEKTLNLITDVLGVLLFHLFKTYGKPERDLRYTVKDTEVAINDFPMPAGLSI